MIRRKQKFSKTSSQTCIVCKLEYLALVSNQKYCSKECRNKFHKQYVDRGGVPKSTTGAAHELMVCADLLKKGYSVYRSVSPAAKADLVVLKNDLFLRIEVTTTYGLTKSISNEKRSGIGTSWDIVAAVTYNNEIVYFPNDLI